MIGDGLQLLVDGVLKRVPYQDNPVRHDYKLTEKGRDLWLAMTALREWGDKWAAPNGPPVELVHEDCGRPTTVVPTCSACGEALDLFHLKAIPGPGAGEPPMVPDLGGPS